MDDHLFEDIEQDNNPSFYGNQSIISDPYGQGPNAVSSVQNTEFLGQSNLDLSSIAYSLPPNNDLVNSSIGLSNQIQQLINDSNLKIDIISSEKLVNSSVIVYSIQLSIENKPDSSGQTTLAGSINDGDSQDNNSTTIIVKRRYSEFKSLRDSLVKLYPTLIIPPIPEKHSIFSLIVNSINNSNEINIIDMRKRYFKNFLNDLIFDSSPQLRNCVLVHKFLDPNYELCWYNALNEPPVNLIPNNLLLANPIDPTDQNGLYSILPLVNGFDFHSSIDNLSSLKKLNDELAKLKDQKNLFEAKGKDYVSLREKSNNEEESDDLGERLLDNDFENFEQVPKNIIQFEAKFHHIIKILGDLNKLNSRSVKNYKSITNTLIELGGNLNNFSLQVYESSNYQSTRTEAELQEHNTLSLAIEKFGSTIDSNFLNFESFIHNSLIPEWQEPIHQLIQYYINSLQIIKFYKYKIIQFKLLYKLKFAKFNELINITSNSAVSSISMKSSDSTIPASQTPSNLDHLKDLNSPSLNSALQRIEARKSRGNTLSNKKSWYGLFGGKNGYNKQFSNNLLSNEESGDISSSMGNDMNQVKFKTLQIEKEMNKLNQLIELMNSDMLKLTSKLKSTFAEFLVKLEKKWLQLMIKYIQNGKQLFEENLTNWIELKDYLTTI